MDNISESNSRLSYEELLEQNTQLKNQIKEIQKTSKKSESILSHNEAKYRAFYENTPLSYQSLDIDGNYIDINPTYLSTLGYKREEVIGKNYADFLHPDWKSIFEKNFSEFKRRGYISGVYFKIKHKKGHFLDISLEGCIGAHPDGSFKQTYCVFEDITEQKRIEDALVKNQFYLSKAQEIGKIGTWELDILNNKLYWTKQNYKNFGLTHSTPLNYEVFLNRIHPDDRDYVNQKWKAAMEGKPYDIDHRVIVDGKIQWLREEAEVKFDENCNAISAIGFTQDITKFKESELKLKQSDRVFNLTLDMFCIAGFDGYFKYLNPAWERTLGWSIEELLSKPWLDFVHPDDADNTENIKSVIVDGKEILKFENRYICKDGSIKWFSWNSQPFPKENIMIGAARDITETKKNEIELLQAKEKAEESEKQLRHISDNFVNGMIYQVAMLEENHRQFNYVSKNVEELYGCTVEEAKKDANLIYGKIHPDDIEGLIEKEKVALKKMSKFETEARTITPNGNIRWAYYISKPRIINGIVCWDGIEIDITERKQIELELIKAKEKAEENQKLYEDLVQSSHNLIWKCDLEGNFTFLNSAWENTHGYKVEEMLGRPFSDFQRLEVFERDVIEFTKHLEGGFVEGYETTHIIKDGTEIPLIFNALPLLNFKGEIIGTQGTAFDITKLKETEYELIRAKEKAEHSERLKSAFLANMSHEIRTPMNGILGFTSLLQDSNLSVENHKDYIDIIKKSVNRLLNTVNDIIEISKIESGEINVTKSEVNIIGHLDTLITFFRPEAKKKNIEIVVRNNIDGNDLFIQTDQNKLSSILSNLIKNAIKYTNEGTINVGLEVEDNQILFTCQDTGIGIPKSRQEAIFNRFEQADIEDKQVHEGSGLGLAIVKTYVEMLDGKIWLESEVGKGSTFYVSLPCKNEKKKEQIIPKEIKLSDSDMKNINVLIVEDEEYSLMHLSILMKDKVKSIITAQNGIEAIDACKNDSGIDLILMDLKMPVMDGITATKKIREFNKDVIIIAQTAYALEGDKEKALEAGCNDYISKPIKKEKLFELIDKYFKTKS